MTLSGLRVGQARLDLRFWREGERSRWEVTAQEGNLTVDEERWQPWRAGAVSGTR